ncbi:type I-E CRISPR-associated protein Cse2/CasB [Thermomicrobium sp.]
MTVQDRSAVRFVQALEELVAREDRGALATLRRGLGKPPGTVVEIYPYVVPYLPADADDHRAWVYFAVASLFAFHPISWPANERKGRTNFGASVGQLAQRLGQRSAGLEARFLRLLAAEREELPLQLYRMLTLFGPHQIPVSWVDLLRDLDQWDSPERFVQRRWARAFVEERGRREEEVSEGSIEVSA